MFELNIFLIHLLIVTEIYGSVIIVLSFMIKKNITIYSS